MHHETVSSSHRVMVAIGSRWAFIGRLFVSLFFHFIYGSISMHCTPFNSFKSWIALPWSLNFLVFCGRLLSWSNHYYVIACIGKTVSFARSFIGKTIFHKMFLCYFQLWMHVVLVTVGASRCAWVGNQENIAVNVTQDTTWDGMGGATVSLIKCDFARKLQRFSLIV